MLGRPEPDGDPDDASLSLHLRHLGFGSVAFLLDAAPGIASAWPWARHRRAPRAAARAPRGAAGRAGRSPRLAASAAPDPLSLANMVVDGGCAMCRG